MKKSVAEQSLTQLRTVQNVFSKPGPLPEVMNRIPKIANWEKFGGGREGESRNLSERLKKMKK